MSLLFEMMKREILANKALSEKYPGVLFKQKRQYIYLSDKEIILHGSKETWPDSVCKLANNFEQNAKLSRIINMDLDWFYKPEEAGFYLENPGIFRLSFAVFQGQKHSIEFILHHLTRCNYEAEESGSSENGVILSCLFKEHDHSDKWNPCIKLRKAYVFLECDKPKLVSIIINRAIKDMEHNYSLINYSGDVEKITEMTEEEIEMRRKANNEKQQKL